MADDDFAQIQQAGTQPTDAGATPGFGDTSTTQPQDDGLFDVIRSAGNDGAADAKFATSLKLGSQIPPERAARIVKAQTQTGMPADFLDRNLDQVEKDVQAQGFDAYTYRRNNPAVADWISQHPNNAAVAREDLDQLGIIERGFRAIGSGFTEGSDQTKLGRLGFQQLNREGTNQTSADIAALQAKIEAEPQGHGFSAMLQGMGQLAGGLTQNVKEGLKIGALAGGAGAISGSIVPVIGTVAGATTAAVPAFSGGFIYDLMKSSAGQSYLDLGKITDANGAPISEQARRYAAVFIGAASGSLMSGGAGAVTHKMVDGARSLLVKEVAANISQPTFNQALMRFGKSYALSLGEQGVVGAGIGAANALGTQAAELADHLTKGSDFQQSMGSALGATAQGAWDGARDMMASMAPVAAIGPGLGFLGDRRAIQRAQDNATMFQAIGSAITDSKTFQRLPAAMQSIVSRITADGPVKDVYIPHEAWASYAQSKGMDPDDLAAKVTGVPGAYTKAKDQGGDLKIPTDRYAGTLAGTDANAAFAKEIRFGPDEPNAREAGEMAKRLQEQAAKTVDAAKEREQTPVEKIHDALMEQQAAAKIPKSQAESHATLLANAITNLGEREGIDPVELHKSLGDQLVMRSEEAPQPGHQEQAIGTLQAPGNSLAFQDLLRQYKKANGDRSPSPGSAAWQDLVKQSAAKDAERGVSYDQTVSTRLPTAAKATEDPLASHLSVGLESSKAATKAYAKNAELVSTYPNLRPSKGATTPDKVVDRFINHVKDNLLWLHDQVPAATRARSKLWYDGARAITDRWAKRYGMPDTTIAAVMAVLSPQRDWFQNVSLAERVLEAVKNHGDHVWDEPMSTTAARIFADPRYAKQLEDVRGKSLNQVDDTLNKAMWVRTFDEAHNPRTFRLITPEGTFGEHVRTKKGEPTKVAWGSLPQIAKAIEAIKDPSIANISAQLGEQHKVRNFYNNIIAPNDKAGSVTIDTHAVAAGLMRPFGGDSVPVQHNFGSGGASSDAKVGSNGVYGLYAEAYRRAAAERGLLPREMQSITWEAVRGLFPGEWKREANIAKVEAEWEKYRKGAQSLESTRQKISEIAGGIHPPDWEGSPHSEHGALRDSSYQGELPADGVPGRGAEPDASGAGGGAAAGDQAGLELAQERRGFIQFQGGGKFSIHLLENANLSTFLHETGHLFLEMLGGLATRDGASDQIKADYQKALEWSGYGTHENKLAMQQELTGLQATLKAENREATPAEAQRMAELAAPHENWARGFEAYLREGKAPSSALRRVFATFAGWLTRIYKSALQLDVNLTPEVRGVMDRLLATDEQIADAQHAAGAGESMFATPEAMDKSPEEFASYRLAVEKQTTSAREEFQRELFDEVKRQQQEAWQSQRDKVEEEVTKDVNNRPVYRAMDALRNGKDADGNEIPGGEIKLSKAAVLEVMDGDKSILKKLPWNSYRVEGGVHPDQVADTFGFQSGKDLILAMVNAVDKRDQIQHETDAKMQLEHPSILDDGTAKDKAADAVQNSERGHVLHMELKALRAMERKSKATRAQAAAEARAVERGKAKEQVGAVRDAAAEKLAATRDAAAAKLKETVGAVKDDAAAKAKADADQARGVVTAVPDAAWFKSAAHDQVEGAMIKDLTPQQYLHNARLASQEVLKAFAKKDYRAAADAKSRELLNHELYRAASTAVRDADKVAKYMRRFDEGDVRAKLAKVDQGKYLAQIDGLTERFQFRKLSEKAFGKLESLRAFVDRIQKQGATNGEEIPLMDHLIDQANTLNYRELTHSDLLSLRDSVKMLEHTALWKGEMLATRAKARFEDIEHQLVTAGETNLAKKPPIPFTDSGYNWKQKIGRALTALDAEMLKMEQVVEWMDGGDLAGPWHQFFWNGASDAQNREYDYTAKVTSKIAEAIRNVDPAIRKRMFDRVSISGIERPMTRQDLLGVALNWGNASNADKLLRGHGWTEAKVKEMIGHLTKGELDFVQGIWDTLESVKPDIWKLQKRLTGIEPDAVEPRSFETDHGTYRGGYYPAIYDPRDPKLTKKVELSSDVGQLIDPQYTRATTQKGHTISRTDAAYEVSLDPYRLTGHIAGVIKDLTHREWLMDVSKIVDSPKIKKMLQERMGEAFPEYFKNWVKQVINDRNHSSAMKLGAFDRSVEAVRMKVLVATEGFKFSTIMAEYSGITQAIETVGRGDADGHKWLAASYGKFLQNPKAMWEFAREKSGEYRHRIETRNRDIRDKMLSLQGRTDHLAKFQAMGLESLGHAEMLISLPTWHAGYSKALSQGYDDATAVRAGDMAVRLSHGSGAAKDLAPLMAKKASMWRAATMFFSTFNALYNRMRDIGHGTTKASTPKEFANLAMRAFWIWPMAGAIGSLFRGQMGPDKDKGESWGGWLGREVGMFPFQSVPGVRDVASYVSDLTKGHGDYTPTPLTQPVTDLVQMFQSLDGDHEAEQVLDRAMKAARYTVGTPTGQLEIWVHAIEEMAHGDTDLGTVLHDIFWHAAPKK